MSADGSVRLDLDEAAVLAMNARDAAATSPLGAQGLRALLATAFHVGLRDAGRTAVLVALDQDTAYASPNFLWFTARYPRFVYVDRVIVAAQARGRGLAVGLYADLFAAARAAGHGRVACEVNLIPANPASDAFHARLGFVEVGRGSVGAKVVRYLARSLTDGAA